MINLSKIIARLKSSLPIVQQRKADNSSQTQFFCPKCQPNEIEHNLIEEGRIYEDSHDFADLMHCPECGSIYLHYWIEIFDDGWNYWVKIDEIERDSIVNLNTVDYPKGKIIALIETKENVICRKPSEGSTFGNKQDYINSIEVLSGRSCLLNGPAW